MAEQVELLRKLAKVAVDLEPGQAQVLVLMVQEGAAPETVARVLLRLMEAQEARSLAAEQTQPRPLRQPLR